MVPSTYVRKLRFNDVGCWFVIVSRYFVLLNNYVTLGLQKDVFLMKPDIRHFFVRSGDVWKVRHSYPTSWIVNLLCLLLCQNYVISAFLTMTYFLWRQDEVPLWYVALRVEITYGITYGNYVSFLFVIVTYCLFGYNYVIYLFGVVKFFDDVRNRFYFGIFKLRMEKMLQLGFAFVRHCNVCFNTSQLRCLFVRCNYVFWWR